MITLKGFHWKIVPFFRSTWLTTTLERNETNPYRTINKRRPLIIFNCLGICLILQLGDESCPILKRTVERFEMCRSFPFAILGGGDDERRRRRRRRRRRKANRSSVGVRRNRISPWHPIPPPSSDRPEPGGVGDAAMQPTCLHRVRLQLRSSNDRSSKPIPHPFPSLLFYWFLLLLLLLLLLFRRTPRNCLTGNRSDREHFFLFLLIAIVHQHQRPLSFGENETR